MAFRLIRAMPPSFRHWWIPTRASTPTLEHSCFVGNIRPRRSLTFHVDYQFLNSYRDNLDGPGGTGYQPLFNTADDYNGRVNTVQARVDYLAGHAQAITAGYEYERENFCQFLVRSESRPHAASQRRYDGFPAVQRLLCPGSNPAVRRPAADPAVGALPDSQPQHAAVHRRRFAVRRNQPFPRRHMRSPATRRSRTICDPAPRSCEPTPATAFACRRSMSDSEPISTVAPLRHLAIRGLSPERSFSIDGGD